jgi:hypothetical protein
MGVYSPNAATLLYGSAGAGKTPLAVSSFWDWKKGVQIANGKYISFGSEDNPALYVPEEFRQTEKGTSLRLTSPLLDSNAFLDDFDRVSQRLVYDAQQGNFLDVLVVDSLSEFDLLFEETYGDSGGDNFKKWNDLMSQMFSMMVRLSPSVLNCHVIMTARVMERKKAKQLGRSTVAGDPGFMDYDFYPSLRGSFRLHLPHYFNLVLYMETEQARTTEGKVIPAHVVNMYRTGDYYIKNQFEHLWLSAGKPAQMSNTMWPELWGELTEAMAVTSVG